MNWVNSRNGLSSSWLLLLLLLWWCRHIKLSDRKTSLCVVCACVYSGQSVSGGLDVNGTAEHGTFHRADVSTHHAQRRCHQRQRDGHHGRLHAQQTAQHDHQQVHRVAGRRWPDGRTCRTAVLQRQRGTTCDDTIRYDTVRYDTIGILIVRWYAEGSPDKSTAEKQK